MERSWGLSKHILIKALSLSLLIHMLSLKMFTVTFPKIFELPKPTLIFLGAILNTVDYAQDRNILDGKTQQNALLDEGQLTGPKQAPFAFNFLNKPLIQEPVRTNPKGIPKTTFELKAENNTADTRPTGLDSIGIDIQVPAHKPLRLRDR